MSKAAPPRKPSDTVDGKKRIPPEYGLYRALYGWWRFIPDVFCEMSCYKAQVFVCFPVGLKGLGSSSRLDGNISTYPGTFKCPRRWVMANKSPGEALFTVYGTLKPCLGILGLCLPPCSCIFVYFHISTLVWPCSPICSYMVPHVPPCCLLLCFQLWSVHCMQVLILSCVRMNFICVIMCVLVF